VIIAAVGALGTAGVLGYSVAVLQRFNHHVRDAAVGSAVVRGDAAELRRVLRRGHSPDGKDAQGMTALYWAAYLGESEKVKILIDAGADIELKSWHGGTPLMAACEKGKLEAARVLIRAGACIHRRIEGKTALDLAKESGNQELVKLLQNVDDR
jgi:uncharacterized protein